MNVVAKYDSAQTNPGNAAHWAAADALSADAANSYAVRKRIRERARLEVANNTYAEGILGDFAQDVVGEKGPRLQVLTDDRELNFAIETEWTEWCKVVDLAQKLRTMHRARVTDGEAFGIMFTNNGLAHPVRMDLRLIECDRVRSPETIVRQNNIDGVVLDDDGNPTLYQVCNVHPGGMVWGRTDLYTDYPAADVFHLFRPRRPEQHRGVSEISASLPLFALLRRFTLATVTAAETAADFAAVIQTPGPAEGALDESVVVPATMDTVELEKGLATVMPEGWQISQVRAEHPSTTYPAFKLAILSEIARPVGMPRNLATGDSSDYNFASGRLDVGKYFKGCRVQQGAFGRDPMDRLFAGWILEARLVYPWGHLVAGDKAPRHGWLFELKEPIDPREARAETERLSSGALGLPEIYASRGRDWREEMEKNAEALGITLEELQALIRGRLYGGAQEEADSAGSAKDEEEADREDEEQRRAAK